MNDIEYDLIIIGLGPGGISAGIYARRANLNVLFIERGAPGGKLLNTHRVDNYPGFKSGSGGELATIMFNQLMELKPKIVYDEVIEIKENSNLKEVITKKETSYIGKMVIVATGLVSKKLNIPGEDEFYGKGLSYCVVCDGPLVRGKNLALIGGGNSAVEESLFASQISPQVYILQYGENLTAEAKVIQEAKRLKNVKIITNAKVTKIFGEKNVKGLTYIDQVTKKEITLEVGGVFPYIGYVPQTQFLDKLNITNYDGFIEVDHTFESVYKKGIFAIGDVVQKNVKQISTAVGDGAIVGQKASSYILENFKQSDD